MLVLYTACVDKSLQFGASENKFHVITRKGLIKRDTYFFLQKNFSQKKEKQQANVFFPNKWNYFYQEVVV